MVDAFDDIEALLNPEYASNASNSTNPPQTQIQTSVSSNTSVTANYDLSISTGNAQNSNESDNSTKNAEKTTLSPKSRKRGRDEAEKSPSQPPKRNTIWDMAKKSKSGQPTREKQKQLAAAEENRKKRKTNQGNAAPGAAKKKSASQTASSTQSNSIQQDDMQNLLNYDDLDNLNLDTNIDFDIPDSNPSTVATNDNDSNANDNDSNIQNASASNTTDIIVEDTLQNNNNAADLGFDLDNGGQIDDFGLDDLDTDGDLDGTAAQIVVDAEGRIVVDQNVGIEVNRKIDVDAIKKKRKVVNETQGGRHITSHTYAKLKQTPKWLEPDTEMFFKAIRQFGADFSMISILFPSRTRREIKNKYKREEKNHPDKINFCLRNRLAIDAQLFIEKAKQKQKFAAKKEGIDLDKRRAISKKKEEEMSRVNEELDDMLDIVGLGSSAPAPTSAASASSNAISAESLPDAPAPEPEPEDDEWETKAMDPTAVSSSEFHISEDLFEEGDGDEIE